MEENIKGLQNYCSPSPIFQLPLFGHAIAVFIQDVDNKGLAGPNLVSCLWTRPVDPRVPENEHFQENRLQTLYFHVFFAKMALSEQWGAIPGPSTKGPSHPSQGKGRTSAVAIAPGG